MLNLHRHGSTLFLLLMWLATVGCATNSSRVASRDEQLAPRSIAESPATQSDPARRQDNTQTEDMQTVQRVVHVESAQALRSDLLFEGPTHVEQLVAYAVANNPEIVAARSKSASRMARIPQARALDDPYFSTTIFLNEIETAAGPQDAVVSISQKFPWFGKRWLRGHAAYHDAQAAYAELANVELTVVEQVKLAYFDLYFIDEAIRVNRLLEPKLKDVIQIARTKYETDEAKAGLESVLQAEVALHKLEITLAELEQARLMALARLAQAVHLPNGLGMDIQTQFDGAPRPPSVDRLVAMLEQCNPQLEARQQEIQRDSTHVQLARKNYFPDFNVGFNWIDIGSQGLSRSANGEDAYSMMVGMNVPIYRGKLNAAMRESRANVSQSSSRYDATWDQLRAEVESLHAAAIEHDRVLAILNTNILRKAEQTLELSLEAYRVDRIGFQQLIDNYEDLLRFRISYHMRRAQREQAISQLERAVGCVVADWQGGLEGVPEMLPPNAD